MPRSIKITAKEVIEIGDWATAALHTNSEMDGYALQTPAIWLRRDYSLTVFMLAHSDETDGRSPLASLCSTVCMTTAWPKRRCTARYHL